MSGRSGTEIATRDIALRMTAHGHSVEIYTGAMGPLTAALAEQGVVCSSAVDDLSVPDIIHLNHQRFAEKVLERFSSVPAIVHCQDANHSNAQCFLQPNIMGWFGVSIACRQRIADDTGVSFNEVGMLPNYYDPRQISVRVSQLPAKPRRWLLVAEKPDTGKLVVLVRLLSYLFRARLTVVGPAIGRTIDNLPEECLSHDLVFGSARCALEAAASGAAVIVCDPRGISGFLGATQWKSWKDHNLGLGSFNGRPSFLALMNAIRAYDPHDATAASELVRNERSLENAVTDIERIYLTAIGST